MNLKGLNAGYLNYGKKRNTIVATISQRTRIAVVLYSRTAPAYDLNDIFLSDSYEVPEMSSNFPQNLKYESGYGAHVILGETYKLDLKSAEIDSTDAYFKLYDLYPGDDQQTAEIELNICVNGTCQICKLTKDDRKWINGQGVDEKAEQNDCGRVYNDLRNTSQ